MLSRESPEEAIELLRECGYTANEIDFESGFWMDYPWAEEFGKLARKRRIALSVHAPIAGFMGHVERDRKHGMATLAIPAEWSSIPVAIPCLRSRSTWPMNPAIGACTDSAIRRLRASFPNSSAHG